jgi:hypothetical protein
MATAPTIRRRAHRRQIGDLNLDSQSSPGTGASGDGAGGGATVSVQDLQQQNSAGDFNNLQPPAIYQGEQAYSTQAANMETPGVLTNPDAPGGGGHGSQWIPAARQPVVPTSPVASSTQSLPQTTGLASIVSLLGQPVFASLPWFTWGWVLTIAGVVIVWKMRKS